MANILIPEELNALIQQYLTDGVLTEKERAVILKEAESMELDREKIALYLDAEEQKIEQAIDAAARKQKGKTCPYCGGSIPLLTDKCPHCGENITPEASEELQEILENLEKALVGLKSGKAIAENKAIVERYTRKAEMYYSNNPKIRKLLEQLQTEVVEAEKRGKVAARNAAISNAASSTAKGLGATIKYIALEHKKLTACFIAAIMALVLFFAVKAKYNADPVKNPKACVEAINKAIAAGDIEQALAFYSGYDWDSGNGMCDIDAGKNAIIEAYIARINKLIAEDNLPEAENNCYALEEFYSADASFAALAEAYWKNGNVEKALKMDEEVRYSGYTPEYSSASAIRIEIQNYYISKGDYDKAEKLIDYNFHSHSNNESYFDFLCKCIDHMRDNGQDVKAKAYARRKLSHYSYDDTVFEKYRQQMNDFLGE